MTKTKRVLVDVDDTLSETQHVLIREVAKLTGQHFPFDEMTREHREKEIEGWGAAVREVLKDPEAMLTCQPSHLALEGLKLLRAEGAEPHIVSSRQEPLHQATAMWLDMHGFAKYVARIHPRLNGEGGNEFKVRIAQEQQFVAAFDDTYEVVQSLAEVVPTVYMIDKPWNRGHDDGLPSNVLRVESFRDGVGRFIGEGAEPPWWLR